MADKDAKQGNRFGQVVGIFILIIVAVGLFMGFRDLRSPKEGNDSKSGNANSTTASNKPPLIFLPTPGVKAKMTEEWSEPFEVPGAYGCNIYAEKGAIAVVRLASFKGQPFHKRRILESDANGNLREIGGTGVPKRIPIVTIEVSSTEFAGKEYEIKCKEDR